MLAIELLIRKLDAAGYVYEARQMNEATIRVDVFSDESFDVVRPIAEEVMRAYKWSIRVNVHLTPTTAGV